MPAITTKATVKISSNASYISPAPPIRHYLTLFYHL